MYEMGDYVAVAFKNDTTGAAWSEMGRVQTKVSDELVTVKLTSTDQQVVTAYALGVTPKSIKQEPLDENPVPPKASSVNMEASNK